MKKSSLLVGKSASKKNLAAGTVNPSDVADNRRAVSKKFRNYLLERVESACAICRSLTVSVAMEHIDNYISTGEMPDNFPDAETLLIFTILRPEIDKAIARSASARMRVSRHRFKAVCRKHGLDYSARIDESGRGLERSVSGADEAAGSVSVGNPYQPLLTRRERRRIEQEERRLLRKRNKPLMPAS